MSKLPPVPTNSDTVAEMSDSLNPQNKQPEARLIIKNKCVIMQKKYQRI